MATLIGFLVLVGIVIVLLLATRSPGRTATRRHSGPDGTHWLWSSDGGHGHDGGGSWFGGGGDFGGGGGGDGGGGG